MESNPIEIEKSSNPYENIIKSESFQKWFSGSVVVDENNEPLVVYHSSTIKNFDGIELKPDTQTDNWSSYGIYFSSDRSATRDFFKTDYEQSTERFKRLMRDPLLKEKDSIIKDRKEYVKKHEPIVKTFNSFLSIKKPLKLNNHQELMDLYYSGATREKLMEHYDGIIVKFDPNFTDQYIIFNPEQAMILPSNLAE